MTASASSQRSWGNRWSVFLERRKSPGNTTPPATIGVSMLAQTWAGRLSWRELEVEKKRKAGEGERERERGTKGTVQGGMGQGSQTRGRGEGVGLDEERGEARDRVDLRKGAGESQPEGGREMRRGGHGKRTEKERVLEEEEDAGGGGEGETRQVEGGLTWRGGRAGGGGVGWGVGLWCQR